jgi:CubicO group peptidase (beta-lactamase class C family)
MNIDGGVLDAAAADRRLSGVVAIDRAGESLYEHCTGFAHRALAVPNTHRTRFGLASGSKIMTALGIPRLVETGALRRATGRRRAGLPVRGG